MTKSERAERDEALAKLREWIKPGDTVSTILRHVSRSGMQREVSVIINRAGEEVFNADYWVSKAIGERIGKHGGLIVRGCGMDVGFAVVYNLGYAMFPDGFECAGPGAADGFTGRCRSNDHFNGDRSYEPHHHNEGGYAFRHQWL